MSDEENHDPRNSTKVVWGATIVEHRKIRLLIQSLLCFLLIVFCCAVPTYGDSTIDVDFPAQKERIVQKLRENGFTEEEINKVFSDSRIALYPDIINRTGKGIKYLDPKFGLLSRTSIRRGQKVLKENRAVMEQIEKEYGVEKEVIIAIYRIETNLGRSRGNYPVFNSLFTMAVLENRRTQWAEKELIDFLIICKKTGIDPLSIKGSWAGAYGICQFIPSSVMKYAVDGDGNGYIDMFNFHDAMASIANYLKQHGWEKDNVTKKKEAIFAYNHCDNYVKAVLTYAKATKRTAW